MEPRLARVPVGRQVGVDDDDDVAPDPLHLLHGPPHEETFQPHEIARLIDQPGLELVEPIDTGVYRRYAMTPVDLYGAPFQTPHMVVRFNESVFTTVMVFLRKRS